MAKPESIETMFVWEKHLVNFDRDIIIKGSHQNTIKIPGYLPRYFRELLVDYGRPVPFARLNRKIVDGKVVEQEPDKNELHAIENNISELRKIIEQFTNYAGQIALVPGVGYQLISENDSTQDQQA